MRLSPKTGTKIAPLPLLFAVLLTSCEQPTAQTGSNPDDEAATQSAKRPSAPPQQAPPQQAPPSQALPPPAVSPIRSPDMFADVAERIVKSVVNISSVKVIRDQRNGGLSPFFNDPFFRHFFGPETFQRMPRERREKSLGSGVIAGDGGVVLTNNHVIEKAEKIFVTLSEGDEEYQAEVVGTDPKSDLAVLRLQGDQKALTPLPFGDSGALRLGEMVLAAGNPFGLNHTVTMGIVSAKGRADVGIVDYEDFIQTDAAINPGNSGGALVNLRGELVGINTAILSKSGGYQGIGFAIPSNMAKPIMDSLLQHGRVVRGWLGVSIQDVTPELAQALDLPKSGGVLIADVVPEGPADKAGLERGDVVISINGAKTDSSSKLRNIIAMLGNKGEANLVVLRSGDREEISVTLGEMPSSLGGVATVAPDQGSLGGLTVEALDRANRKKFEIPERLNTGVIITNIEPGSPAHTAGLSIGDVLLELNRKPIPSVQAFTQLYQSTKSDILLLVYRRGSTMYLVLKR